MLWSRSLVVCTSILPFTACCLLGPSDWTAFGPAAPVLAFIPFVLGAIGMLSIVMTPVWGACILTEFCCDGDVI